ncbi:hypothetical protein GPALN_014878 [Globodera pallida]|nr:hypothetical protein GPALN_014878 [Globodera pallida]
MASWILRNLLLFTFWTICIIFFIIYFNKFSENLNTNVKLILITPTMLRPSRLADMTRLSQTLMHVKNVHWIVIEDGDAPVASIKRVLIRSGIKHTYLAKNGSAFHKMAKKVNPIYKGKAWAPRNTALEYVRQFYGTKYANSKNAVLYFVDDDNSYDLRIFHDYLPKVKSIGLWAVGLSGKSFVEAPKVKNNTIVGWFVYNGPERQFGIDMAGFAVNLNLFLNSNASFHVFCNFPEDFAQHCLGTSGTQKKEQIIVSEEPEHGFDLNEPWIAQQNDNDILGPARILLDLNEPAATQDEEKDELARQDDEAAAQDEEKDEPAPQDEEEYQNMNALASSSNQKGIEQPNPSEKAQLEYSTITTENSQTKQKIVPFCASSSKNGTSKDGIGQEMVPEARHRKRRGAEDKDTHNIEK